MHTPLLVVGAGPFGLAISAYAKHLELEHIMLGVPMGFWRAQMPAGMVLRSDCSWHLDPLEEFTIHAFLETRGETPANVEPLSLAFYLEYADWFQKQRGLESHPGLVESLDRNPITNRFSARLDTGEMLTADSVVIAPGFGGSEHVPVELASILPTDRYAHTSEAVELSAYAGERVVIVGGRQAAFEWAALLAEAGARSVDIVYRHDTPRFTESDWSWMPPIVASTVEDPGWYRRLSGEAQQEIADRLWEEGRLKLELWLGGRIDTEAVALHPGRVIVACDDDPDGPMRLRLDDESVLAADRVILATGYEPDITRLNYLTAGLLREIETVEGSPALDTSFQTSVPGLYITSKPAARDFGPFMAFTVAARASAVILGKALASN